MAEEAHTPAGRLPHISVIVPVYNDVTRLALCLSALAVQDYGGDFNVIVADNASTEDVHNALPPGDSRFSVIRELQAGSYAARNTAARIADGDVLAFTDADCLPHPSWLSAAVKALNQSDRVANVVGGAVNIVYRKETGPTTGPELYEASEGFDQEQFIRTAHFAATANLIVPRKIFDEVGEFDATLKSGGDLQWGQRLHAKGFAIQYSAAATIDHPSRPAWSELTLKTIRIAHGHADLFLNPAAASFVTDSWHSTRRTFTIWWSIWKEEWPPTKPQKLRLAAARSYAGLLEIVVRTRRGAWRHSPVRD